MNESVLARALYRGTLFAVGAVALVLVGVQLKWVFVQVFAAAIVAAGMAPVVARFTNPARAPRWRWRPSPALVVFLIYLGIGLLVFVLGSILLSVVLTQGTLLAQRAPELASEVQAWYLSVVRRWSVLEELDLWDL